MEPTKEDRVSIKEQKAGELTRLLQNAEAASRVCHEFLNTLEDKLHPVLRQEPKPDSKARDIAPAMTGAGGALSEILFSQYNLQQRLEDIIERLEV